MAVYNVVLILLLGVVIAIHTQLVVGETIIGNSGVDPCYNVICGENTRCQVYNNKPMCSCKPRYKGSPITGCVLREEITGKKTFIPYTDTTRTWEESLAHCTSVGMKLATINSQEEQDNVHSIIRHTRISGWWWIGGSDSRDTGNYRWISTKTPITYTNWESGEPDNNEDSTGEMDHCIDLSGYKSKWYDHRCSDRNYLICERYV